MGFRLKYEFHSRDGNQWYVRFWDSTFAGEEYTLTTGQGFTLDYESERNKTPFSGQFMFSAAKINLIAANSDDETIIETLRDTAAETLVVEILQNESPFWRGVVLPDLITRENRSTPYVWSIPATDGLKRLALYDRNIAYASDFAKTLAEGFVSLFNLTEVSNVIKSSETLVTTANRWYENAMPATGVGIDPFIYTNFAGGGNYWQLEDIDGDVIYRSAYEVLEAFLKAFKCFVMMRNGHYHIIQHDQYGSGVLYLHAYPKNYPTGSASVSSFNPNNSTLNIEAGSSFAYAPEIARVRAKYDVKNAGRLTTNIQKDNWQTEATLATVTRFTTDTQLKLTFINGPTAVWEYTGSVGTTTLRGALSAKFTIKVRLSTGPTYFLTDNLGWSTSSSDALEINIPNVSYLARSTGIIIADATAAMVSQFGSAELVTDAIPVSGSLTLEIDPLLFYSNGSTGFPTTGLALSSVTALVNLAYTDPSLVNGTINYELTNNDTNSSFEFDDGDVLVSDLIGSNFGALRTFNGTSFGFNNNWKRQATGTAYPITNLGLRILLEYQSSELEILNGSIIASKYEALQAVNKYSKRYVLNRASFVAQTGTWTGTWIEFPTTGGGATIGVEDPTIRTGGVGMLARFQRPNSQYFDRLENSAFIITTTDAEVSGTVTSISINSPSFNIAYSGVALLIVDPTTGNSDQLELSADLTTAATTVSFASKTLSQTYPIGSYIYMEMGQVLNRIYDLETP